MPPNNPPPNAGVVVEADVEVVALSAGFGGSPKNPPGAGAVVVVVVDESPAGLGGPPNNPPVVVVALRDPPKRPPDVAVGVINTKNPKVRTRIYLVLEHPCSPQVFVHRINLRRQRQGQEQRSRFHLLQLLE